MPNEKNLKIVTPEFRVSFPSLDKPDERNGDKYVITMLFDKKTDIGALKAAAKSAAIAKWGDKIPSGLASPFADGDEKDCDGYAGHIVVKAKTKIRPTLLDRDKQEILDPREVYAGCYARASVVPFAYGGKGTTFEPGVAFMLQAVQKLRDGEAFGRGDARLDFDELPADREGDSTQPSAKRPAKQAKAAAPKQEGFDEW